MKPEHILALLALGLLLWKRNDLTQGLETMTQDTGTQVPGMFRVAAGDPYEPLITATEQSWGIPQGLLYRLLYQESHFRPDIINGGPNYAGAIGIAQIVPRWHPDITVAQIKDPSTAIPYAGKFLAQLFKASQKFYPGGSWKMALAAYNWGAGNVVNAIQQYGADWDQHLPAETHNYVAQITNDVPVVA